MLSQHLRNGLRLHAHVESQAQKTRELRPFQQIEPSACRVRFRRVLSASRSRLYLAAGSDSGRNNRGDIEFLVHHELMVSYVPGRSRRMSNLTNGAWTLQWPDYLIITLMLLISVLIGVYYRFTGGRQRTMEEYFSADRSVGVITLTMGLSVSFVSGIAVIGLCAEAYGRGSMLIMLQVGLFIALPLIIYFYLPVFYKSNTMSVFEYLDKRFGPKARVVTSISNCIYMTIYSSIVLFVPAMALESTTGLSGDMSVMVFGLVCTFYSTLGGIKAVLITDVIQALLILAGLICTIAIATIYIDGGLFNVLNIAYRTGRMEIIDFRFDPTIRHTTWNTILSSLIIAVHLYGVSQVQVQRCLTAKSLKTATYSLLLCGVLTTIMFGLIFLSGLFIYAVYEDCDPFATGKIKAIDRILLYFVADKMAAYPGTSGVFIAGVFSASLSTISAIINALSVTTLEDYVKPFCDKCGIHFTDEKATLMGKIFALVYGAVLVGVAFSLKSARGLVALFLKLSGVMAGPIVGIFTLGMFVEAANENGSIIGMLVGFIPLVVVSCGPTPKPVNLQFSTRGCDNSTLLDLPKLNKVENEPQLPYVNRISYMLYPATGLVITIFVGYVASLISTMIFRKDTRELDPDLFVPFLAAKIRRRREVVSKSTNSQHVIMQRL